MDSIIVFVPTLRAGVPSNAAGMAPYSAPYATREEALAHKHWANQSGWADAAAVEIKDAPWREDWSPADAADRICGKIVQEGWDAPKGSCFARAAELIQAGKRVEAMRIFVG